MNEIGKLIGTSKLENRARRLLNLNLGMKTIDESWIWLLDQLVSVEEIRRHIKQDEL